MEEIRVGTEHYERESGEEYVAPGVPIVRSSTPKPLTFRAFESDMSQEQVVQSLERDTKSNFPIEAPAAPPLPEECEEIAPDVHQMAQTPGIVGTRETVETTPLPLTGQAVSVDDASTEFLWLFEYAIEMDGAILNSAERLGGLALLYGPAVLKGYEMAFDVVRSAAGEVVATIVPGRKREVEVWGVLYRVPRRLAERLDAQPALLDKIHGAVSPDGLFERVQVVVHEALRGRHVTCIAYIASAMARNMFHLLPRNRQYIDASYAQRLLETARKQQLPADYIHELTTLIVPKHEASSLFSASAAEQNTEPLPVLKTEKRSLEQKPAELLKPGNVGMVLFALYLLFTLITVCMLAILHGLNVGRGLLPTNFTVLGVPWFVLVYGLIGGCLSCMIALGQLRSASLPNFVLITWYARPYIGGVLAALMYLLLNSGLLHAGGSAVEQKMMLSLLAVLAGFGERWLFYKRVRETSSNV